MNEVFLSIAIASYNHKKITVDHVKKMLEYKGDDIEVVVTDDASPDGTVTELKKIEDSRLKVIEHEKNSGGTKNFITSLFNTVGQYVLYCNDRDVILANKIDELIKVLKEYRPAYMWTCNDNGEDLSGELHIYHSGYDAVINNPIATHPTGGIFNGELLRKKLNPENFYPYVYTVFPERFLAREMCCMGTSIFWEQSIYHNGSHLLLENDISSGVNPTGKDEDFYFYPSHSWDLFFETYRHIFYKLPAKFNLKEKKSLIFKLVNFLYGRFPDYKRFRSTAADIKHYKLVDRKVSNKEVYQFMRKYTEKLISFLFEEKCEWSIFLQIILMIPKHYFYVFKACNEIEEEWKKNV